MDFVSLDRALEKHKDLALNNFEKLGANEGFLEGRTYLVFDEKSGWDVVRFNVVEKFLRILFGFLGAYKNSHPKAIQAELDKLHAPDGRPIRERVRGVWENSHPSTGVTQRPAKLEPLPQSEPASESATAAPQLSETSPQPKPASETFTAESQPLERLEAQFLKPRKPASKSPAKARTLRKKQTSESSPTVTHLSAQPMPVPKPELAAEPPTAAIQPKPASEPSKEVILPEVPLEPLLAAIQPKPATAVIKPETVSPVAQPVSLMQVLGAYKYPPLANRKKLEAYYNSKSFQRHAKTARIYYNSSQLAKEEALRIVFQREPTNIAMGSGQYNEEALHQLFGYRKGVYNDSATKKVDGSSFGDLPNTAAVYSETFLWNPPGGSKKKEIACLSLPAPALDSSEQPHYKYYVNNGKLDAGKYEKEMQFLFKCIERAVRDNKDTAFEKKGIKRVVLSKFGQEAFLGALSFADKEIAHQAYRNQLKAFLANITDVKVKIVMSEYSQPQEAWHPEMIVGDIIKTARKHDLIINAWDPHSAPGNGNDADKSFDGAMGKASGILPTQSSWLNPTLKSEDCLVQVS